MIRQVLFGTATYMPGVYSLVTRRQREGNSARYCYAVWLRHLALAHQHGLNTRPGTVAELGPGGSHGVGLCALIMGSEHYYGCDVVRQGSTEENLKLFDELVAMFRRREPIPGDAEFPRLRPRLSDHRFPEWLRSRSEWARSLAEPRLARIRASVASGPGFGRAVEYIVPWQYGASIPPGTVDLICSQAVLQYIDDLGRAYHTMHEWLAPGGTMSHTVDFSAHQTSNQWDAHWTYSPLIWRLMRGRRPYWLNRQPCSTHLVLLRRQGFDVIDVVRDVEPPQATRTRPTRVNGLSSDDLSTRGAFTLSRKPVNSSFEATTLLRPLNNRIEHHGTKDVSGNGR